MKIDCLPEVPGQYRWLLFQGTVDEASQSIWMYFICSTNKGKRLVFDNM